MRKIMCIFLLTALLLSTLAACNAPGKTPDGTPDAAPDNVGNDTSADTTTDTPIVTTVALPETTVTEPEYNIPEGDIAGRFYCEDNIDMSEIEVKICVWHQSYDQFMQKVLFSVKTDENGVFHFTPPDGEWFGEVNCSTIVSGYGVLYENKYFDNTVTLEKPLELVQAIYAEISFNEKEGLLDHKVNVCLKDKNGAVVFGPYDFSESYEEGAAQKILANEDITYSATVTYGNRQSISFFDVPVLSNGRYSTREKKINRMLELGIIDQAQYDELITSNR